MLKHKSGARSELIALNPFMYAYIDITGILVYYTNMFRQLSEIITDCIESRKPPIILLLGLRQTGKTTLAKTVCQNKKFQLFNFDLVSDQQEFTESNRHSLENFAQRYKEHIVFIDEVQKLPEATNVIKHLYDQYNTRFILTGSSELKIKQHLSDSLAGRVRQFRLYPLSIKELLAQKGVINSKESPSYDNSQVVLQKYLVYGSLPNLENISSRKVVKHDSSPLISEFGVYLETKKISKNTIKNYLSDTRQFLSWLETNNPNSASNDVNK